MAAANKKALIAAGIAAITGFALLHIYLSRREQEISGGPAVAVLVAARDISPGSTIRNENLGVRSVPRAYLEQRHIRASESEKIIGAMASTGIKANETVLWTDLAAAQAFGRSLSGLVQEGMRALTISTSSGAFSGLIRPGDRVDVLFTAGARLGGEGAELTSTILQNLLVLAVGSDIGGNDENARSSGSGNQVTLGTTAEQAQLLTQASQQGSLNLTLRNPNDIILLQALAKTTAADVTFASRRSEESRVNPIATTSKEIEHVR